MAAAVARFILPALLACLAGQAQTPSALNAREFDKHWTIESEAPDYRLTFVGADTAEIVSPKGLTLWRREKMQGSVVIEYDACVMDEGRPGDRLSDLNCFWMARDPQNPGNIGARARWRSGIFVRCYTLQLYYLGYGDGGKTLKQIGQETKTLTLDKNGRASVELTSPTTKLRKTRTQQSGRSGICCRNT